MSFSTSLSGGCTRDKRYIVKTYCVDTGSEASDRAYVHMIETS
jgi:hypothetical protein